MPSVRRHFAELVGYGEAFYHFLEVIEEEIKSTGTLLEDVFDIMYNKMTIKILQELDIDKSLMVKYLESPELKADLPKLIIDKCKTTSSKLPQPGFTTLAQLVCLLS